MIPWLKRFFNDEETFLLWQHRVATIVSAGLASLALGLMNGSIPWPAWVPPWLITVIGGTAAAIGVGQMNRSVGHTKALMADTAPLTTSTPPKQDG